MEGSSESDFYLRKIHRLEEEVAVVQTECSQLRHRLRAAEDYEIRYHILVKTSETEILRLKNLQDRAEETRRQEAVNAQLAQHQAIWQKQAQEIEESIREQAGREKAELEGAVERLRGEVEQLNAKREEMELFGFKTKKLEQENEGLRGQLADTRKHYEKQREEEAAALRNTLNSALRDKLTHQRTHYETKITTLERQLLQLEMENDAHTIRPLPDNPALAAIQQLHQQQTVQGDDQSRRQQQLLREKSEELRRMLREREAEGEERRKQEEDLKKIIKYLEDELHEKEKQHQQEIYDLVKHINQTKEEERSQLKQQLQEVRQQLASSDAHWHAKLLQQVQLAEQMGRLDEQERTQLHEEKRNLQNKVKELLGRLEQNGIEREAGETELLIRSLKDIEHREEQTGSYDNGITFLERQLRKCQLKLEEKTRALKHQAHQTAQARAQTDQTTAELKQRLFQLKQTSSAELTLALQQIQDLNDQLREKEREIAQKEQQSAAQVEQLTQKYRGAKELAEETQRDYSRAVEGKKKLERECRELREKGTASTGECGVGRRQKWLELEKQKNQLQIIFREREQRLQAGSQLASKSTQLDKTSHSHAQLQQVNELLRKEVQRLREQVEENKENRETDNHKKMATLQLEVALTQNIYESLLQVKGQSLPADSPARKLAEIDLREDDSREPMLMSCHQTSPRT